MGLLFTRYRLLDATWCENKFDMILKVREIPGWLFRAIGLLREKDVEFMGSSTVWHSLPSCQRMSTSMESMLGDFCTFAEHNRILDAKIEMAKRDGDR